MSPRAHSLARGLFGRWVEAAAKRAGLVLAAALALTIAAGYVTVTTIGIDTDTTDMLSEELAFRQNDAAMSAAFPQLTDVLSIVVEARAADAAGDAAARLAQDLRARPADFHSVFYAEGDPFFRRNGLLYLELEALEALADRLARAEPMLATLSRDMSLRGLAEVLGLALDRDLSASEQRFLSPVLERLGAAAQAVVGAQGGGPPARPLSWGEILSGTAGESDDRRRFILAQPVLDYGSLEPAARAIATVRARAAALGLNEAAGVRVRLTGGPVMLQDELRSVKSGLGLVGLASLVLVSLILAAGLRSPRLIVAVLATLIMGLVWTAGFAALAVGELNLISVAFAVLFIGLSVDFGIHFVLRYREALDEALDLGTEPHPLRRAAEGVGGPLSLAALAAAIGFLAFFPTSYRGLSELGLISGTGMFIALIANLTVLPAILRLWPAHSPAARITASGAPAPLARAQAALASRPGAVLSCGLALGLAALLALPFAGFDDDPLNLRDPASESVATLHELIADPRVQPYSADLLAPDLARAQALAAALERQGEVEAAVTLADYLPGEQDEKIAVVEDMSIFLAPVFRGETAAPPDGEARREALARLRDSLQGAGGALAGPAETLIAALDALDALGPAPESLLALERAWLGGLPARLDDLAMALEAGPVGLEDLPRPLRERGLAADGRARIEIRPAEDLRDAEARRRFVDAVVAVAPNASGTPITITAAGRAVVRAFLEAATLAVVAIAVLLLLVLRSLRDSLLVLAPLALAALLTVAATVVLGMPFNFANVIALPLLFGLGVAGGIHVVVRARETGSRGLIGSSTPRAVLLSALTTIASFGALAMSEHRGTASMGVLLTVAIALSLATTLILLPALLALTRRN